MVVTFIGGAIGAQYGIIPHHYYYDVEGYELPPYRNELILEDLRRNCCERATLVDKPLKTLKNSLIGLCRCYLRWGVG